MGTLLVIAAFAWSAASRNVKLQTFGACTPCQAGFHAIGSEACPRVCVASSLEQAIE